MAEQAHTPWTLQIDEPDYLDGIRSGHTIRTEDGRPVAYAFNDDEGRVIAAAPDLLEALKATVVALSDASMRTRSIEDAESWTYVCEKARAAITLATLPEPESRT